MSVEESRYNVLVEFAYRHLDFQMAELKSVLEMNHVCLGSDECRILGLVNDGRFAEELALSNTHRAPSRNGAASRRPFLILSLAPGSEIRRSIGSLIMSRCILVRSVIELWGMGESTLDCAEVTKQFTSTRLGKEIFQEESAIEKAWKLTVHMLGSKASRDEQSEMREAFSFLAFKGPVQMVDPVNEFILIQEVELDANGGPLYPKYDNLKRLLPENANRPPLATYFGRTIGQEGRKRKGRGALEEYHLRKRKYLGPTSMDAELSFVMTNLGHVKTGDIVLDPFVGTGSILLSCACRGAYCIGTDIDIRVLRGRNADQTIWSNFHQFGLPRPEIIRSDNSIYHRHFRDHQPLYDAILTDPPYGIRAGARKSGSRKLTPRPVKDEERHDHIAQTMPYAVSDVMIDLLQMASRTLKIGGRLVYVIPSFSNFDPEADLPRHDCLELIHWSYQPLGSELGRRIVVMKKVCEYDCSKVAEYARAIWKVPGAADKVANIREQILEAAKQKPNYEERLLHRKKKRKEHKAGLKRSKTQTSDVNQEF